jgi:hypothetical protein
VAEKPVVTDNPPVTLSASCEPHYFSPDDDGENDLLSITLGVKNGDVAEWTFDILQTGSNQVFKRFEGTGTPSEVITWDGFSDPRSAGKDGALRSVLVEPAADYPYIFAATDTKGKAVEPVKGVIHVDILLTKLPNGKLQIRTSPIIFRANAADFEDLPEKIIADNGRILRRIAENVKRFAGYKVQVEGYANPETAPGTKQREAEVKKESAPGSLSEKRAEAILSFLTDAGIENDRITALGMGISNPVVQFADHANWRENRRVEFYLDKGK